MLWLAALVSVLALAVTLAIVWPVRVQASIEGRADPTGFYALASGVSIGPFAVAAVVARGVPGRVQVHILSRLVGTWTFAELWSRGTRLSKRLRKPPKKKGPPVPVAERVAQVERGWARINRFLDPIAFARFVFAERKRFALDYLDVALRFGGDDVALTGRIVAAIMVLDGMFGARVSLKALSTARSLANATMPDGVKYEDWVRRQSGDYVPPVITDNGGAPAGYVTTDSPLDYTPVDEV